MSKATAKNPVSRSQELGVTPESFLQRVEKVRRARVGDYGGPVEDFTCTAAIWSAYLSRSTGMRVLVLPEDVPIMLIQMKTSRFGNRRQPLDKKGDTILDIAGYADTAEVVRITPSK